MARKPGVRRKNGYWYSEAGGVGRYFGGVQTTTQAKALAMLYTALAEGEGVGEDSKLGVGVEGGGVPPSARIGLDRKAQVPARSQTTGFQSNPIRQSDADARGRGPSSPNPNPSILSTLTVNALRDKYLAWVAKHRAKTNHKAKVVHLRRFADAHGQREATAVTGGHLESFLSTLSHHSTAHIHKHEVSVRAMYRWGLKHGLMPKGHTPFVAVEAIRPPAKVLLESDLPTADEVQTVIANATPTLADFLIVQHATGARTGELRGANVGDFQPKAGQVVLRHHKREHTMKSAPVRVLVLNAEAQAVASRLAQGRPADEPLFPTPKGLRWGEKGLSDAFIRARVKAKVREKITPYSLRHLWISEALMAGLDAFLVAKMVGTSVAMIEKVYGRFRAQSLADAQAKLDAVRLARA